MTTTTIQPVAEMPEKPLRRRKISWLRVTRNVARVLLALLVIAVIGGYLYYRSLRDTPQYSLALLVDAAKHNNQTGVDSLINVDSVVDDFVPQITAKAAELYGRGLPQAVIDKLANVAAPLMPAVKQRARAELPRLIRDRVERLPNVPFPMMVVGADRYLDIVIDGDTAVVKSKLPDHPLEMKMRRYGDHWQIVGVRDEKLATDIARAIGQQMMTIAAGGLNKKTAESLGVGNLADLLRRAEELVR